MARTYLCTKCMNELAADSSFCDNCGSSVAATLWDAARRLEDQLADLEKKTVQKKKRRVSGRRVEKALGERFSELYKKGMNDREMARVLNITPSAVYRYRKKLKLAANAPRGFQKGRSRLRK